MFFPKLSHAFASIDSADTLFSNFFILVYAHKTCIQFLYCFHICFSARCVHTCECIDFLIVFMSLSLSLRSFSILIAGQIGAWNAIAWLIFNGYLARYVELSTAAQTHTHTRGKREKKLSKWKKKRFINTEIRQNGEKTVLKMFMWSKPIKQNKQRRNKLYYNVVWHFPYFVFAHCS